MPMVVATGAFCPAEALGEAFGAFGWQVMRPDRLDQTAPEAGPVISIVDDDLGQLAELLTAQPAMQAVVLHATREEALAVALCEGIEPAAALERWHASALEQVALFRRMRRRVALVSRQRFEAAPEVFLGDRASGLTLPPWRADPLALLLAKEMMVAMSATADTAASMLAACMREEDRGSPIYDIEDALAAWQRQRALAAEGETAASQREEITLLQEHLVQMQATLETTWQQREESRHEADAGRKAQAAAEADLKAKQDTLAAREQALTQAQARIAALEAELRTAQDTIATQEKALDKAVHPLSTAPETSAELERLRQIEASQGEEISLLREHLAHLQSAFEETWLKKDEITATASRQPPLHEGLTVTVDLGTADAPRS
jgi:hypothetical protein